MKLAVIYSDRRGIFVGDACGKFCNVTQIDLSDIALKFWQKALCAFISLNTKKEFWRNDFYRNPLSVYFRMKAGNSILKKQLEKYDGILQFGLMNTYDYPSLFCNKVFYYVDGAYDRNNLNWLSPKYGTWFSKMQKNAYKEAEIVFTFSKWAKQQHINQVGLQSEKIVNVGWGPCLNMSKRLSTFKDCAKNFIIIGNDPWVKGLDLLLEAFKNVQEKYNKSELHIVGIKDSNTTNCGVAGVRYHGYCDKKRVEELLRVSDVFVFPSRFDRAGHAIVEAMGMGLPVITSDVSGTAEPVLSGKCGIVLKQNNVEELRKAMITLIENPQMVKTMSGNALVEANKNWTWEKVCEKMVNAMGNVVNSDNKVR